jgi:phosphatidylserine decarboxylase
VTIDRAGLPFILIAAAPAVVAAVWGPLWLAVVLLLLPLAIALFFRDPERAITAEDNAVLAPADGKVMHAGPARPGEAPPGTWQQITIFLSVLDVHINRTPVAGVVKRVEYIPGKFLPAYRHDAHQNERSEIWIDHKGVPVVVRQVVGLLARRVVCRLTPGQVLAPGARIGLMKFGSRMDVFVPGDAEVLATAGATVTAGVTVIARLRAPEVAR